MYRKIFHLDRRPFSATPDPRFLYRSPSVRTSLGALEQTLRSGEGIGLLTAPAGTGKTLVCKVLVEQLANDPLPVLLLNSNFETRSSLLQTILFELGRPYVRMSEQELRLDLVSYGRKLAESQTGIAIIVDEAHLLNESLLEELRSLTNFMYESRPIFRVALSGQLALEEILTRRNLEAFNQRLHCHVSLDTLSKEESAAYIATRIQQSGGQMSQIFSPSALELIVHAADGLPRCLNQLCDHACLLAAVAGTSPVQPSHVREALDDLQKLPLHWNVPLPAREFSVAEAAAAETPPPVPTFSSLAPVAPAHPDWSTLGPTSESGVFEIGGDSELTLKSQNSPTTMEWDFSSEADVEVDLELGAEIPSGNPEFSEHDSEWLSDSGTLSPAFEIGFEQEDLAESESIGSLEIDFQPARQAAEAVSAEEVRGETQSRSTVEDIDDPYARLDARRKGQLLSGETFVAGAFRPAPVAEKHPSRKLLAESLPVADEPEYRLGQTLLEISADMAGMVSGTSEETLPDPQQVWYEPQGSRVAEHDLVAPENHPNSTNDYDRLYSELRRKP